MGILDAPGLTKNAGDARYFRQQTPANAGTRTNAFDQARSAYNFKPSNTLQLRATLAKALAGTSLTTILMQGDSKIAGTGANGAAPLVGSKSMPGRLRGALQGRGYPIAGTSFVPCCQNGSNGDDDRYAYTGTWTKGAQQFYAQASTTGATCTFTSDFTGTVVEIWALGTSATFDYQILGAAGAVVSSGSVTQGANNFAQATTVTGLAPYAYQVKVTTRSTSAVYLLGMNVRNATGVQVTNAGVVGSTTAFHVDTTSYKIGNTALLLPADVVIIALGVNDARAGVTTAAYETNMNAIIAAHKAKSRAVIIVVPSPPAAADQTSYTWAAWVSAMYDLADSNDVPLVDFTAAFQTYEVANPLGLYFDTLHESAAGYAVDGNTIVSALAP